MKLCVECKHFRPYSLWANWTEECHAPKLNDGINPIDGTIIPPNTRNTWLVRHCRCGVESATWWEPKETP